MSVMTAGDPRQIAHPRPQPGTERPPLRLVEPDRRPRRLRLGLVSTLSLAAVFFGLLALAAMHSLVVQAQFELDRVDQAVAERRSEIEQRRVAVARLESPAEVVAAAEALGMVEPSDRVYLLPQTTPSDLGGELPAEQAASAQS